MLSQRPVRTRSYRALLHLLVAGPGTVEHGRDVDAQSLHATSLVWQEGGAAGCMCTGRLRGVRVLYDRLRRSGGHAPPEGGGCL